VSIAAAILILAGGCFAAWYATSQHSESTAPIVNSNPVATISPLAKPSVSNGNVKSEEKVVEKTEEKDLNLKAGTSNLGVKPPELANKTVPIKTTDAEPTPEESPAPIIVKSAPPTEDLKRSRDKDNTNATISRPKSDTDEPDNSEDVIDALRKQKKADSDQPDEQRLEKRERRANERRRKQKLPTLLGAPQ
jgi:hypothetical protein